MTNFRNSLISTNLGQLFSANLYDGIKTRLIEIEDVKNVLSYLKGRYLKHKNNNNKDLSIEKSIADLSEDYLYKTKFMSCCNPVINKKYNYYNVVDYRYINILIENNERLSRDSKENLMGDIAKNRIKRKLDVKFEVRKIKTNQQHHWGALNDSIKSRVWLSRDENLWKINNVDEIRDKLGLVHIQEKRNLGIMKFNHETLSEIYRPTVIDAGVHTRFKWAHKSDNTRKTNINWGRTVDLKKLSSRDKDISGCREAVALNFNVSADTDIVFKFLGETKTGTNNKIEDHKNFANIIRQNKCEADIIKKIEKKIQVKINEL